MRGKKFILFGFIGFILFFVISSTQPMPCVQPYSEFEFWHSKAIPISIITVLFSIMGFVIENTDWAKKEAK